MPPVVTDGNIDTLGDLDEIRYFDHALRQLNMEIEVMQAI